MNDSPPPEPKQTGVDPVQTGIDNELQVLPPEGKEKAALLSSAVEGSYARGLTSAAIPLLTLTARNYELQISTLTKERDKAHAEAAELREKLSTAECRNARLSERLRRGPALAVCVSAMQIIGGILIGTGFGQIMGKATAIAWATLIIGGILLIASFIAQYRGSIKDDES